MQHLLDEFNKLWNGWEIRVLILLSLFSQYVLFVFGSRRKYVTGSWIQILVWLAYMLADWVATVALGILAKTSGDFKNNYSKSNHLLQAFWAPFLLLHLGGPDTITAFALEDNNLWLRHFLGLLVQVVVAFYVFFRSWSNNAFTFLAIPVFITGIIKYGERTCALRSSSTKQFRGSLLSDPDPGPDYATYTEAYDYTIVETDSHNAAPIVQPEAQDPEADNLHLADYLFKRFQYLFADLILGINERMNCYKIIDEKSPEDAFKLIEAELGFMYDLLYTKATIACSQTGIILRFLSFFSAIFVSVAFCLIIEKHAFPSVDIIITYLLVIGALVLDVYGFILLIFSDWTKLWLIKNKNPLANLIRPVTSFELPFTKRKRWSGSMAQNNLISACLKPAKCLTVQKLFGIHETLEKYRYTTWKTVDVSLQKSICKQLWEKGNQINYHDFKKPEFKQLMGQRGDYVLEKKGVLKDFQWCTTDVEFDHSLLLWHIATDLYYHDVADDFDRNKEAYQISKWLSDYMLYLLVLCPSMLPKGIGEIRYRDTCAEARRFFKQRMSTSQKIKEACKALLQVNTNVPIEEIKGDRSQSVLFYGCKLAKQLKSLGRQDEVWEMISQVWVEMLTYAASRCEWKEHGQLLRKGGELLSHVCLLMAHLGLSDQYQSQTIIRSSFLDELVNNKCFLCLLGCMLRTQH